MPIAAARLSWAFHGLAVSSGCGRQEADTAAALESTGTKSAEPPESLAGSPPSNGLAENRQPEASAQAQQPQALAEARQPQSLVETQQPQSLDQAQLPQNLTEAQQPQGLTEEWHLEDLAGSWRLDGQKTTEKLQGHDSLQSLWGTGFSYGSDMEIGADGSFSFYITINYGGTGTLTKTEGGLLAEGIVPMYQPKTPPHRIHCSSSLSSRTALYI